MNWLNVKTEFSFGAVYGHIEEVVKILKKQGSEAAGIADINGTYGFIQWEKECNKQGIKPIFGVKLTVVSNLELKERRGPICEMTFVALTNTGLKHIYKLTELAYNQFYYIPRVSADQVSDLPPEDVLVLSGVAPNLANAWGITRVLHLQLSPDLPYRVRDYETTAVACIDNHYPRQQDQKIYEPFADNLKMERKTSPQWIMTDGQWTSTMRFRLEALKLRDKICKVASAKLQKAPFIKFPESHDLWDICKKKAPEIGVDLKDKVYLKRLKMELRLINEKEYTDYFLVVADIITWARGKGIFVGPGRGSSGGSLVCYLLGITTFDPLQYDLIFERFIDVNRTDLPDIDVDFPEDRREEVLKYISKKYGAENVSQISNINKLKAKSTLNRVLKNFGVNPSTADRIKNVLIERTPGDTNANKCLRDTITATPEGEQFIKDHPYMKVATKMEGHASHTGVHAAGVLVSNHPIVDYCGMNSKDKRVAMIDMREAEYLNLLKIDALGLRTLSILASVCSNVGLDQEELLALPDGDPKAYQLLNNQQYAGIFQLEGAAARGLASQMVLTSIEDLAAISAIARPGPLQSGGANRYIQRKSGVKEVTYTTTHKVFKKATKPTAGVIVYQEQVMRILKDLGGLPWAEVIKLRKLMGKTMGSEAFGEYQKKFVKGAIKNGVEKEEAKEVWETLVTFGKYGFNKSHSVAYSYISYWGAYLKAHYPMEFALACLNNAKSDKDSILLLREMIEGGEIKEKHYKFFDKDISEVHWSSQGKKIYAGYMAIDGIGVVNAKKAVSARLKGEVLPPGIASKVKNPKSELKYLYPARDVYGGYCIQDGVHEYIRIKDLLTQDDQGNFPRSEEDFKLVAKVSALELRQREGAQEQNYYWLRVEDDTGEITCFINDAVEDQEELSDLKVGSDWVLLRGIFKQGQFAPYFVVTSKPIVITKEDP